MYSQEVIALYPSGIPNSKPSKDEEVTTKRDAKHISISKISRPTLTIFLAPQSTANGTAVVICPGGGYVNNAAGHEGYEVAKALNEMGISAFVLKYRIPRDSIMVKKEIGPLQDGQRAIQVVRERAKDWHVNPARVGIMGFSAGGHLASTVATHLNQPEIENKNNINLRPDFLILLYPVISFTDSLAHMGSRKALIGPDAKPDMVNAYSNELQVTPKTPPTFLVHAGDDKTVKVQNSIVFYEALLKNKVPAEMHIYPGGGHGFGMENSTTPDKWMDHLKNWFEMNGWLKK
ncbi:MAG: alpha/beta hydrolase [Chitinophagaceae bacterium]